MISRGFGAPRRVRSLPHSAEIERAILGAIMLHNPLMVQARQLIQPADFYIGNHQLIFRSMITLNKRGDEIGPITIGEELRREGLLDQVGGITFLSQLTYGLPHFADISHYAKVIRGKFLLRRLIEDIDKIAGEALEDEDEPDVTLDHAEKAITVFTKDFLKEYREYKQEGFEELERVQKATGPTSKSKRKQNLH